MFFQHLSHSINKLENHFNFQVFETSPLVTSKHANATYGDGDAGVQIKVEDSDAEDAENVLNKAFDGNDSDGENEKKFSIDTPKAKKSLLTGPRTPTPFKNALDEFRKIRGQTYVPSSPNGLVEDITEIMNNEKQQDSTVDSVYETDCSTVTQNTQADQTIVSNPKRLSFDDVNNGTTKKAKKSLESTWSNTTTTSDSKDLPYIVETPVSYSHIYWKDSI